MQKRIAAIALCLIMVSAFTMTTAVSAAQTDNSAIRQFDIKWKQTGVVIGQLTIDTNSGHYTVNINPARFSTEIKTAWKDLYRQKQYEAGFVLINTKTREVISLGNNIALTNDGGNIHGEGTLSISQSDLTRIAGWNEDDVSVQFAIG